MTVVNTLGIALLAVMLLLTLTVPWNPRWQSRPWFIDRQPSRSVVATLIAVFLVIAVIRAL